MTEQELRDLDVELDSGTIDEEQYCATLRDEVARIHSDYDPCTIENMIRMQLRIEALESVLVEDVTESDLLDASGVVKAAGAGKEGCDKSGFKEDDKDSQIKALLQKLKEKAEKQAAEQKAEKPDQNGEQGVAEKPGAEQQHVGQQEDNEFLGQKPGQQNPGSQDGQQQNDQNKQNGKDDQSQQDQSKQDQCQQKQDQQNQQKDNGNGGKSNQKPKVWWTWQIVPDWNE